MRWGGGNLANLKIYLDHHTALHFRGGKAIALSAKRKGEAAGKKPCLLFTERRHMPDRFLISETEHISVIVVPEAREGYDPLLAHLIDVGDLSPELVNQIAALDIGAITALLAERLAQEPGRLAEVLQILADRSGGAEAIAEALRSLVELDANALEALLKVAEEFAGSARFAESVSAVLSSMTECDAETVDAIGRCLLNATSSEERIRLLTNIMSSPEGNLEGAMAFADSFTARLDAIQEKAEEYNRKVATAGETEMQEFLEQNPWILSLDHSKIIHKAVVDRGEMDFMVKRFDGVVDSVELKGPGETLLRHDSRARPGSPHEYRLGQKLANALPQALAYHAQAVLENDFADGRMSERSRLLRVELPELVRIV